MRRFLSNKTGVSNIVSYLFSLTIATMVMTGAIIITNTIIDDKINDVAEIEAENIANYVANAIAEAASIRESMPDADYEQKLSLPAKLAGKNYYLEVTDGVVWVKTTDGKVSKSAIVCNSNNSDITIAETRIRILCDAFDCAASMALVFLSAILSSISIASVIMSKS